LTPLTRDGRDGVRVNYWSKPLILIQHDMDQVFWSDMINAIIGGIIVCFLLLYQLSFVGQTTAGTIGLTLCAIIIVTASVPLGIAIFRNVSGQEKFSLVNCLAFFFILGIGIDDILVFSDAWIQAKRAIKFVPTDDAANDPATHKRRMRSVASQPGALIKFELAYVRATKACFVTTIATSMGFIANFWSPIPTMREFSVFMVICIYCNLLLTVIFWLPILLLHDHMLGVLVMDKPVTFGSDGVRADMSADGMRRATLELEEKRFSGVAKFLYGAFTTFVYKFRCFFLSGWFVLYVLAIIAAFQVVEMDTNLPTIFPVNHNQVIGKAQNQRFTNTYDRALLPPQTVNGFTTKVCDLNVSSKIALGDPYIWGNDCEDALDDLDGTSGNRNPCGFVSHLGECSSDHQETCPVECGLCDTCFMYKCMDDSATTDPLADPQSTSSNRGAATRSKSRRALNQATS